MNLYIFKNGQQQGPYPSEQVGSLIANGTLLTTDLAWYEGQAEWIPLSQVPGLTSAAVLPPARRPVLVWVISLFYFIFIPIGLLALAATPYLISLSTQIQHRAELNLQASIDRTTDADRKDKLIQIQDRLRDNETRLAALTNHGFLYYALSVLSLVVGLAAAILLFLLKRAALYAFITAFILGLLSAIYSFATTPLPHTGSAAETTGLIIGFTAAGIGWLIAIAILVYVGLLFKRGVLR